MTAQPDTTLRSANLQPQQLMKLLATLVAKFAKATGGPICVSQQDVIDTVVDIDVQIMGDVFIVQALDPAQRKKIVAAPASILDRLNNGSSLTGVGRG